MTLLASEKKTLLDLIKREQLNIKVSQGWTNLMRSVQCPEMLVFDVASILSLRRIVRVIYTLNLRKKPADRILVRPAAGGLGQKYSESHSVHGVLGADIVIRLVGQDFLGIKSLDRSNKVVTVGAATQVGELNRLLNTQYQLALPNASLTPYVTVAGLAANAGVGTGRDEPAFPSLIRYFQFCLPNGDLIEMRETDPCFPLAQSAHQGLFGFVTQISLQCRDAVKLRRVERLMSVADFFQNIRAGLFTNNAFVSAMLQSAYHEQTPVPHREPTVRLYHWEPVSQDTPDHNAPTLFGRWLQESMTSTYDFFRGGRWFAAFPRLIPLFTRSVLIPSSIGKTDSTSVTSWSQSVHHQTSFPHDVHDVAFLFEVSENGEEIIGALTIIYQEVKRCADAGEYPLLTGMYLRYLTGSNGGVSTTAHQSGKHVCSLDLVSSTHTECAHDFFQTIWDKLRDTYGARLHLGKWLPADYQIKTETLLDVLWSWYARHGLSLERSMLLTAHYCHLYAMPRNFLPKPGENPAASDDFGVGEMTCLGW